MKLMRPTLQKPLPPMPLNSIDGARQLLDSIDRDRRVGDTEAVGGQSSSIALTSVVKDALIRHYGSLKAAALTLGIDQGQLTRELQSGDFKLKKLDQDTEARAFVARAVFDAFGADDPKARARRLIREARARLDELAEVVA